MVVKFSILIVSFFICSFIERKEINNAPTYKPTFENALFESGEIL
jgi:hypothetical protein